MMTPEERSEAARKGAKKRWTRAKAPDVNVMPRSTEPQHQMLEGKLDDAQRLINARLNRTVFDHTSGAVRFADDRLVGRWFNQAVNDQQIYRARQRGWIPVTPEMVSDLEQLGVYQTNDSGHVVRGQRGQEHLMAMTKDNADLVAMAKTVENDRRLGTAKKAKDELAEAAAAQFGSEAGDFMHTNVFGEVRDGVERIDRVEAGE